MLSHVHVSRSKLDRRFKLLLHRTPREEILRVRLDQARRLLAESSLPIETIARQSGFATYKYFGDVFQRELGIRPGAYRKRYHRQV